VLWDEYKQLSIRYPNLSAEEEDRLARRAVKGDEKAIDLLVKHNANRILFFANMAHHCGGNKEDFFTHTAHPVRLDDAICVAAEALVFAIKKFDPDKPRKGVKGTVRFTSWANLIIRQRVYRFVAQEKKRADRRQEYVARCRQIPRTDLSPGPESILAQDRLWSMIESLPDELQTSLLKGYRNKKTMALLEEMATEEEFKALRAAILDWRSVING